MWAVSKGTAHCGAGCALGDIAGEWIVFATGWTIALFGAAIVLVDYHLPRHNGLLLSHRIKRASPPPKVLVYTAYASPQLAVAATIAGSRACSPPARPRIASLVTSGAPRPR